MTYNVFGVTLNLAPSIYPVRSRSTLGKLALGFRGKGNNHPADRI